MPLQFNRRLLEALADADTARRNQEFAEQGQTDQESINSPNMQVNVDEPQWMPQVPDTSVRPIRNTYQTPDVSPMSTNAQEALLSKFQTRPTQTEPNFINKLISGLAGSSTGWFEGAGPGLKTAEAYRETPYNRALKQWEAEAAPLVAGSSAEAAQNKYNLDRSKILADIARDQAASGVNVHEAQTKAEGVETGRFGEQRERSEFNRKLFETMHPEQAIQTVAQGPTGKTDEVVGINKRTMRVQGTGLKGYPKFRPLSDYLEMIGKRNEGLKELFNSIPEKDAYLAQEDAIRHVAYSAPEKFGQFIDRKTGFIKPMNEIMSLISDPATKTAYDDFLAAVSLKAEESLSKYKSPKAGKIMKPGIPIGDDFVISADQSE